MENCRMEALMTYSRCPATSLGVALFVLCLSMSAAVTQEVDLVPVENKALARGYSAEALKAKLVINDKRETIGHINDFIFGRDEGVFAVLAVGDFVAQPGHLVAVPFRSLKLDDPNFIVLPGASRGALQKLPIFIYGH
jgi:hypothetical protein